MLLYIDDCVHVDRKDVSMTAFESTIVFKVHADTDVYIPGAPHDNGRGMNDHHDALLTTTDILWWVTEQLKSIGITSNFSYAPTTKLKETTE